MPFSPLPASFIKILENLSLKGSVGLELGCGEGDFTRLLARPGIDFIGLDSSPIGTQGAQVVGDALSLPIMPESVDLVVASNLVKHLLPADPVGDFLKAWQNLLKPGGKLVIFEDEPEDNPPAVQNYQDVQLFLAQLVGQVRGPLLSHKQFETITSATLNPSSWQIELEPNGMVADPEMVLNFMGGSSGLVAPEVAELMNRIRKHGLEYGNYWWACWPKADADV